MRSGLRRVLLGLLIGGIGFGCDDPDDSTPADPPAPEADTGPAPEPEPPPDSMGDPEPPPDPDPDPPPDPEPGACVTDDDHFTDRVRPILESDCVACHRMGGPASETRYVLALGDDDATWADNRRRLEATIVEQPDFGALFVEKPTNAVSHGGGRRFDRFDDRATALRGFVDRVRDPQDCVEPPEPMADPCGDGTVRPGSAVLRRLTDAQYRNSVADIFGVEVPDGLFPATTIDREFRTWPVNNTVSAAGAESIMFAAEHVAAHLDVEAWVNCARPDALCARDAALQLAERAFRRPLVPAEATLIESIFAVGLEPRAALRQAVELIAQSPQFLYLDDAAGAPVDGAGDAARLDAHALASRLSYFLADSAPDAELVAAAARGELETRAQVAGHARRLVADPRARRALTAFHRDWLDTWRLRNTTRDPERYPDFGPHVVDAMLTELDLFVTEVVWAGDARFGTLMGADATWVDTALAVIYGMPDPGEGWHRVRLDGRRPGVLTRAAFLAAHAYAGSSSPVQRGAFVLHDLLCETLSPPADVNMDLPEPSAEAPTIRERLEQHWTSPQCRACHVRIDPLGFSFEHFGALGEWRDTWEGGVPIDATGAIDRPSAEFDGAAEMITAVAPAAEVRACYARRWFEYAVGRPAEDADACTLRRLAERFAETDGDIRNLLVDITLTDAFRYRTTGE